MRIRGSAEESNSLLCIRMSFVLCYLILSRVHIHPPMSRRYRMTDELSPLWNGLEARTASFLDVLMDAGVRWTGISLERWAEVRESRKWKIGPSSSLPDRGNECNEWTHHQTHDFFADNSTSHDSCTGSRQMEVLPCLPSPPLCESHASYWISSLKSSRVMKCEPLGCVVLRPRNELPALSHWCPMHA